MQAGHLVCPHCASTLNFGVELAAGSTVECLICMRTFVTQAAFVPPAPVATAPSSRSAPPKKAAPTPPVPSVTISRPAPRRTRTGSRGAVLAVVAGLLLLAGVGGAFAIWKYAGAPADPVSEADPILLAKNPPGDGAPKVVKDPLPKKDGVDEDEDEIRRKKAAEQPQLIRKTPEKEPGTGPIDPVNVSNENRWGIDQKQIDAARSKGIVFLKAGQKLDGSWVDANGTAAGYTPLAGLTLLESKVPATDRAIQDAARYIRQNCGELNTTYELATTILFLDRLGDPRDRILIQGLAVRLVAGQYPGGAWSYVGQMLDAEDMYQLLAFLQSHQPNPRLGNPLAPYPLPATDPLREFSDLVAKGKFAKAGPIRAQSLKQSLHEIPAVKAQGGKKGEFQLPDGPGDLSNTQFALLALWAARRHGVPSDHVILMTQQRISRSQTNDGSWAYDGRFSPSPAMTCVGLLGEALGHAISPERGADPNDPKKEIIKPAVEDRKVRAGLTYVAKSIGEPPAARKTVVPAMENLYLLWSIERVALLYDLKTIDGKDWYGWGAEILVKNQHSDGSWINSNYHSATPTVNTCFALLFLNRSNLVQDLTLQLQAPLRK